MSHILTELPQGFGSWEEYAASLVAENRELRGENARLKTENELDELTGVMSRRALERTLNGYMESGEDFALAKIDLDGFGEDINDRYGHAEGDRVLARFGRFMYGNLRRRGTDSVGRMGGDEFLLALEGTDGYRAWIKIEETLNRWQEAYRRMRPEFNLQPEQVNFSCGVSEYSGGEQPQPSITETAVYHQADTALYQAKRNGKNRVVLFQTGMRM